KRGEDLISGDTLAARDLRLGLVERGVQAGTILVVELVDVVDDRKMNFGTVGQVHGLVHDDATIPYASEKRQRHQRRIANSEVDQEGLGAALPQTIHLSPTNFVFLLATCWPLGWFSVVRDGSGWVEAATGNRCRIRCLALQDG